MNKCKRHPEYKADDYPPFGCRKCLDIYEEIHGKKCIVCQKIFKSLSDDRRCARCYEYSDCDYPDNYYDQDEYIGGIY